ncbi:MAG: tRNA lysidine(34) synthetase TilS [Candidatus Midichloria sp.]|uniref:tRNA(Ile)-lysidine synthetase n=1 Tax=Hyalomma marginatum TaxID=34627 RepID=A0A8S4C179_9ACAR|nr:tRNA lysidine(34) synthetase TilS [Hyalomma marginatum]CAG7599502.1 tRNA lysidine(34) synthetase TilS [Hyalomma marginatum]
MINIKEFAEILKVNFGLDRTQKIALAVSGGADSMCMAFMMHTLGFAVTCLIVDHGLRPGSTAEVIETKTFLNYQGIEVIILKWLDYDEKLNISNIHQKARDARYSLLIEYCIRNDIQHLALAHNKNDQAENVLIRIGRGTGIDGLAQMSSYKIIENITVIRPLLDYTRDEIEETLKQYNWPWVNDPSNLNPKFTRSRARELLSSDNCLLTIDKLNLLAKNALRTRDYLEKTTLATFYEVVTVKDLGYIKLDIQKFLTMHEEIQLRVLSCILRSLNNQYSIRLNNLENLLNKIRHFEKWSDATLHGCEILKIKQPYKLIFIREKNAIKSIVINKGVRRIIWDTRFIIELDSDLDEELRVEALTKTRLPFLKNKLDNSITLEHNKLKWILPVMIKNNTVIACPLLGWPGDKIKFKVTILSNVSLPKVY